MVVDCFPFYNELKMLNFRLHELNDYVDYFILVEATHTHTGKPKPLYFQEKKHLFKPFLSKIIHIVVDDFPETEDTWVREKFQRAAISRGLDKLPLQPEDTIIISDCDEITNFEVLKGIKGIYTLEQDLYYYNLNTRCNLKWDKAKIMDYATLQTFESVDDVRLFSCPLIPRGGWHLSYFGDTNFIINKLQNFAHTELNTNKSSNPDIINEKIINNKDLFGREGFIDFNYISIEENDFLPKKYKVIL